MNLREAGLQLLQAMFLLANSSKGNFYGSAAAQEIFLCNRIKFDSREWLVPRKSLCSPCLYHLYGIQHPLQRFFFFFVL